jgi:hypothetical protein
MTNQCVTNLLPDEPTTHDIFGSHERVASAIAELVSSETVGRSIAVTGPWGSGKSSVLRIVKERLAETADVFIFDAWAHEGDPLRRTFLERLIDFLTEGHPEPELAQIKKDLLLRKKTQELTTTPVLTLEAKLAAAALLLVPVGLAIFSTAFGKPNVPWYLPNVGLALPLVPLVPLLLLIVAASVRAAASAAGSSIRFVLWLLGIFAVLGATAAWQRGRLIAVASSIPHHREIGLTLALAVLAVVLIAVLRTAQNRWSDVFQILLNKTVTSSRAESVESLDPSSIEFQHSFAAIVDVYKRRKRRLVIAIDNLDRVEPPLALQLWATMRTFFEFDFEGNPWARESVWLLAAFDINGLRRLWPAEPHGSSGFSYHSEDDSLADSFVNKTFQASFAVPPLVLLNRDDYLLAQLKAAFPGHDQAEFHAVIQLYDLRHLTEISTPRAITHFVNSIGSIHRQWRYEIRLAQQALYVVLSRDRSNIAAILTETPQEIPEELIGSDWRNALAAIHFNVPMSRAAHVFMSGPLTASLTAGDASKLSELSKIMGFGRVLEDTVIRNQTAWLNADSQNLTNAVFALNAAKVDEGDQGIATAWRWLTRAASRVERWAAPTPNTGIALSVLITRSTEDEQRTRLLKLAGASLPRSEEDTVTTSQALQSWASIMKPVLDLLPALPESCELVVAGSAKTYTNLLKVLKKTPGFRFDDIAPRLSTEAWDRVAVELGETIRTGQVDGDFPRIVRAIARHRTKMEWTSVIEAIESIFTNVNNNVKQPFFGIALEAALVLSNSAPAAVRMLENLAARGYLHHYFAAMGFAQTRSGVVALLILLLFGKGDPTQWPGHAKEAKSWYSGHGLTGAAQDGSVLRALADLAVEFSQVERLRSASRDSPTLSKLVEMLGQ